MGKWEDLIKKAATAAAVEAATNERARCLWCADQIIVELEVKLKRKLLSTAELHTAETKLKIARVIVRELQRAIVSGIRPVTQGAADFSPPAPAGPENIES